MARSCWFRVPGRADAPPEVVKQQAELNAKSALNSDKPKVRGRKDKGRIEDPAKDAGTPQDRGAILRVRNGGMQDENIIYKSAPIRLVETVASHPAQTPHSPAHGVLASGGGWESPGPRSRRAGCCAALGRRLRRAKPT